MNFMSALHLMGFCAETPSGASMSDLTLHTAFCRADERLANWVG
jgi:hypothetical protein